jgi:hypothetical protein
MIIYYSSGYMCNGLFQYSFLRSVAKPNEKIFCVDGLMGGMKDMEEGFNLNDLNFYIYSPRGLVSQLMRYVLFPLIFWLAKKRLFNYFYHNETISGSDIKVTKKNGLIPINIVKTDYYQNEFLFNKDSFELTFKDKYNQRATNVFNCFPKDRAKIFVHIRRGDYLSLLFNGERGVNLPMSYFKKAMDLFNKEIDNPFYIFLSDDPEYLEQAFQYIKEEDKYISKNSPVVDLCLMSMCEYGVCSNSTFAWWGSYFMKNKEKIIFPRYWLGWKVKEESHPGIYPSWSTIIDWS